MVKLSHQWIFVLCFLMLGNLLSAQILHARSVKISISGTSTLHEWDMLSTEASFVGTLDKGKIKNIQFTVPVETLVSGKNVMDENMKEAMESEQYPNIVFKSSTIETLYGNAEVRGQLTIKDVTKTITIPMSVQKDGEGFSIQGFTQINMRDYGVEPPKFMLGAVKTGEIVSIKFSLSLVKE